MESILDYDPSFFDNQEDTGHNLDLVQLVGIEFKGNLHAQWFNMFVIDLLRERAANLSRSALTFWQYFATQEKAQKLSCIHNICIMHLFSNNVARVL